MNSDKFFTFPNIDSILFYIGPLSIGWYSLMYIIGFLAAWWLAHRRLSSTTWTKEQLHDLLLTCFIGAIVGGRIGYVFFYQFDFFLINPLYLFKIWTGGMSFYGGCIGVFVAIVVNARKWNEPFLKVSDFIVPLVPIGLGAGRIGNFLNAELWGRTTNVPWGFIFPGAGPLPRHPSQIYEFLLEGAILFVILWSYSAQPKAVGSVAGLFLTCYGVFRFVVEFFRAPDPHLGLNAMGLSHGQVLSIPMIVAGLGLIFYAFRNAQKTEIERCSNT